MTEEIEAHVLKKYEILQKLGKYYPYIPKFVTKDRHQPNDEQLILNDQFML